MVFRKNIAYIVFLKLISVLLLIGSFAHPMNNTWSALTDVFMNTDVMVPIKLFVGILYFVGFTLLLFAAYVNLKIWGIVPLLAISSILIRFFYNKNTEWFSSQTQFDWISFIVVIFLGWIVVFGKTDES